MLFLIQEPNSPAPNCRVVISQDQPQTLALPGSAMGLSDETPGPFHDP